MRERSEGEGWREVKVSDLFKTRHDFDFGPRQMSTLASRIAPIKILFYELENKYRPKGGLMIEL